jgi:flagellar hook-length control protein FliK
LFSVRDLTEKALDSTWRDVARDSTKTTEKPDQRAAMRNTIEAALQSSRPAVRGPAEAVAETGRPVLSSVEVPVLSSVEVPLLNTVAVPATADSAEPAPKSAKPPAASGSEGMAADSDRPAADPFVGLLRSENQEASLASHAGQRAAAHSPRKEGEPTEKPGAKSPQPTGDMVTLVAEPTQGTPQNEQATQVRGPVSRQPVVTQVAESIYRAVATGRTVVRVRLHPRALGSLDINLSLGAGGLTVQIKTVDRAVKNLLEGQLGQLHAALETRGMRLEGLSVVFAQAGATASGLLTGGNAWHRGSFARQSTPGYSRGKSPESEGSVEITSGSIENELAIDYRA